MNQLFASVGQSIGQSISPSDEYSGLISFRIDQFDLPAVQGTFKSLLQNHSSKQSFLWYSVNLIVQLFHQYITTGITIFLVYGPLSAKWCLGFWIHCLSWSQLSFQVSFNFIATVTIHSDFGAPQNKVSHCFHCFPIYLPWSDGTRYSDLSFLNVAFKPAISLSSFTLKRLFSSSSLSAIRVVSSAYLSLLIFLQTIDSSLCFIQPGISHDILCLLLK